MDHECRCFPKDDDAFVARVRECDAQLIASGISDPGALQRAIREHYAWAVVRPQTALAATGRTWVWYVYRDGYFRPDRPDRPGRPDRR